MCKMNQTRMPGRREVDGHLKNIMFSARQPTMSNLAYHDHRPKANLENPILFPPHPICPSRFFEVIDVFGWSRVLVNHGGGLSPVMDVSQLEW